MKNWIYRLLLPFLILQGVILVGILGYMIIEKYSFVEALYMTSLIITTVGFQEVKPLSESGQVFTVILLIMSWASLAFFLARITQFIISGEVNKFFKSRKMIKAIEKLSGHVIICGFGRNGQQAANTLRVHNVPYMVIEKNTSTIEKYLLEHTEIIFLEGDATEDETLQRAGISRARALITALPIDAENVFIVLSARALNPTLRIISRASNSTTLNKLKKAGANNVIMPDKIGGTHMATLVSKPDVIEFIDYLSGEEGESINMESVAFEELPRPIRNKSLHEVMNWRKTGVNCIGIKNNEGKFIINPPETTIIEEGMKVIVLGNRSQIDTMKDNLHD